MTTTHAPAHARTHAPTARTTQPRRSAPRAERLAALTAPAGLAVYGVSRYIDGLDGGHGLGLAWNVGHVAFLVAMLSFAVFAVAAARRFEGRVSTIAASAVALGVAAFTWVIAGDLVPAIDNAVAVPDAVTMAGPLLLLAGLVPLLVLAGRDRLGRAWMVAPAFGVIGFVLISVNLDLLLAAAAAFGVAFVPLALAARRTQTPVTRA